jgi:carbon-monoxide dehydrogenase medium subunit
MIPARFDYEVAASVEDAIQLLREDGEAKLLAGGHSLLPLMRLRFARPSRLVDIGRLSDLSYVKEAGDSLAIGALTRHHDLATSGLLKEQCPIVAYAAAQVGDPQVRHRGTIGGSVAHGDPASDLPTVLLALDADFVVRGPEGEKTLGAGGFFTGFMETALGPQDVLTEIRVPKIEGGCSYVKFNRRAQDWATVGVAAIVSEGSAKIALTNMGPTPVRASAAEAAFASGGDPAAVATEVTEGTSPPSDTNGSAEYRRHLATVLTKRALEKALSR